MPVSGNRKTTILHQSHLSNISTFKKNLFADAFNALDSFLNGPPMSGHLLCRDTFSMYALFYHVNVLLMKGHLVNADSGQGILVFCPC